LVKPDLTNVDDELGVTPCDPLTRFPEDEPDGPDSPMTLKLLPLLSKILYPCEFTNVTIAGPVAEDPEISTKTPFPEFDTEANVLADALIPEDSVRFLKEAVDGVISTLLPVKFTTFGVENDIAADAPVALVKEILVLDVTATDVCPKKEELPPVEE
jgi:hypothetical protein